MVVSLDAVKVNNAKLIHGGVASGTASINPTFRDVASVNNEQRSLVVANEKNREEQRTSASRAGDGDPAINASRTIDSRRAELLSSSGLNGSMERMMDVNQELARLSVAQSLVTNIVNSRQKNNELLIRRLILDS